METTVVVQGTVDNIVKGKTKTSQTDVWTYQVATYGEDGKKRLGDVVSYEDKGLKVGQVVILLCWQSHRIWKDKVFTDTNIFKGDREAMKFAELKKYFITAGGDGKGKGLEAGIKV